MTTETSRLVVTVFDTAERADRAASALAANGFRPDQVRIIAEPDVPPDFPAHLVAAGVPAEAGTYYAGSVMASVGPHGGSLRVPAQIRDGTS